jgi:hypothetical protein
MSVSGRLRRAYRAFRSEDWKTLYEYSSDQTEPDTFVSELVSGEYNNSSLWQHLLKVSREDPIAKKVTVGLSQNVFDDWFVIKKRGKDEEELEEHPENDKIQGEFVAMNAKFHCIQALTAMRTFGHCPMVLNYNKHRADVIGSGYQVATLDIFTDEHIRIPTEAFDKDTGIPTYIGVKTSADVPLSDYDRIEWDDLIWWCVDPKARSIYGYSALLGGWDLLTYMRGSIDAMAWVHKKHGVGIFLWWLTGALDTATKDAIESAVQGSSSRRALTAERAAVESVEWIGPPSGGTTSIVDGADFMLGLLSSAYDIPKDVFTGVAAGAITGSEINNKTLYATINKTQSDIEPFLLKLMYRMGYDTEDMVIEWNTRYATDELQQAQVRQMNADALVKEKQAERPVGADFQIGVSGLQDPKDPKKQTQGVPQE